MPQQNEMLGVDTVQETVTPEELANLDVDIPESEVTVMACQAVEDSLNQVGGNESLTYAQSYMAGVLMASDYLSPNVAGQESLFSSIGSGLAKTWKYIKDTFAKIWGFFFRKKAKEEIKEAAADAADLKDAIKASEEITSTEVAVIESVVSTDIVKLEQTIERDMSMLEKLKAMLSKTVVPMLRKVLEKCIAAITRLISRNKSSVEKLKKCKTKLATGIEDKSIIDGEFTVIQGELLETANTSVTVYNAMESDIKSVMVVLEKDMTSTDPEVKKEVSEKMGVLKAILTAGNMGAQAVSNRVRSFASKVKGLAQRLKSKKGGKAATA